jgi:hypothetical protein
MRRPVEKIHLFAKKASAGVSYLTSYVFSPPMKSVILSLGVAALVSVCFAQPALTIYNQNFAVVREKVPLDLKEGETAITFAGATRKLEPDSVVLRDPAGKIAFRVLEQSYRSDTVSQPFLLSLYEGKEIDFLVRDQDGREHTVKGKIVRSGYAPGGQFETPIVEVDGKLRFSLPGEPVFPALGDEGVLKPTLTWQIGAERAAKLDAELSYITSGFAWEAAYNFVAPETGETLDVVGWVTISNKSGQTFTNAAVKLMAGDVNRIQPPTDSEEGGMVKLSAFSVRAAAVSEKAFDEFHLYTLPRQVTLRDKETKQVEFMRATGIKAPVVFVYDGQRNSTKVAVMREFKNSEDNGLGLALPKGRARFYRRDDADGRIEFVGEDSIDHTAKDEMLRIRTGDAFDVVGERAVTAQSNSSYNRQAEQEITVKLRNHKTAPVQIRVVEHLAGLKWEILSKSDDFVKKDAQTLEFTVPVKPNEERVVTYHIRYDWR